MPSVSERQHRAMEAPHGLAFDRASVRTYDRDGRLHVEITNISKAAVNPYIGREIPDWKALGLDPDRVYKLLRDPDELAKAAPTFNNIPLLSRHVPVTADDHKPDLVIGSTGTDADFDGSHLRNSLVVWARDAIDDIESDVKKELSAAYRYRADMTPGTYEGEPYDGVMRDLVGNHVAIVREGRAGSSVVVGDAAIPKLEELFEMSKKDLLTRKGAVALGALMIALKPKLAMDAKIDLAPLFKGVTAKNFKEKKAAIVEGVTTLTAGKLAQDASISDVATLLDSLEGVEPAEATVTARITQSQRAIRDAERKVRPYVGELAIACDSAEAVYRAALSALGLGDKIKDVHASALPTILGMQPLPGSQPKAKLSVAMDAAGAKSFADRVPDANRIRLI
jgi:hypothetical protein